VSQEIVATAADVRADFLVLATDSHAGMKRLLRSPLVGQVVRDAPCPTFIAPRSALLPWQSGTVVNPRERWRRVLVPVDLSEISRRVLQIAASLAGKMGGGEVRVFYVPGLYDGQLGARQGEANPFRSELPEAVRERLWAWARQHVPASLVVTALGETGIAGADVIARVAEREQCDLVVVGYERKSWWNRLVNGSLVESLAYLGCNLVLAVPQATTGEGA
jgi:nucleotide-binding universal stress UspA family protein